MGRPEQRHTSSGSPQRHRESDHQHRQPRCFDPGRASIVWWEQNTPITCKQATEQVGMISTYEAALYLGGSPTLVQRLVHAGKLPAHWEQERLLHSPADLDRFIEQSRIKP